MTSAAKRAVCQAIDRQARNLVSLSHDLHRHPETAFGETRSSAVLARSLGQAGLSVVHPAHGMPTAFRAEAGMSGPRVVLCCEYDALPDLGHACGHNVVAAAGVGAAVALAPLAGPLGGIVVALGTPAEEGGGGKITLLERGAFEDADAVLLLHPGPIDTVDARFRAADLLRVEFVGRASHAALAPEVGRNALDAAVLTYQAIGAARARLSPGDQLDAVITSGATSPGVVPARAEVRVMARSATSAGLPRLTHRVRLAAAAGARTTGCRYRLCRSGPPYAHLSSDPWLAARFAGNARVLGRRMRPGNDLAVLRAGSTDLGNVSHVVPTIHPKFRIGAVPQHSAAFARAAGSVVADRAVLDGAKALAMTVIDVWTRQRKEP